MVGFVHALIVIQSESSRIWSRLSVVAACVHISVMHACWPGDEMTRPVSRGPARESNTKPQHQHSELLYLFPCSNSLANSNRIRRTSKAMQLPLIPCIFAITLPSIFTTLPSDLHQLHLFSQAASPVICALPVSAVTKRRAIWSHAWNNNNIHEIRALQEMFVPTTRMWTHVSPNTNMSYASSRWKNKWQPRDGTFSWSH